ncbi:MAG: nucleotidyltransferase family protein [Actinomycetota bacterium]|nr:nucleotidyltransferase family protein [Actinomycetota bacterium]
MSKVADRRPREVRVAAVLLAAGEGTRFAGGPKLLARFRGRPLLAWAVAPVLEAGLPLVVVRGEVDVAGALPELVPGVTVLENPHAHEGQATSLRAAIAWCDSAGFDAAVVGLGDQPLVPASAWRTVAEAAVAPIVSASFGGLRRPPVRLDREIWPLLPETGDEGARALMRQRPELVAAVACEGDPVDVDTVAELLAFERRDEAGTSPTAGARERWS